MSQVEEITKIYNDNADKIYRFLYVRVENSTTAEDLTSQVFLKMVDKFSQFDSKRASVTTWLFTIAKNTLVDYYRSAASKAGKNSTNLEDVENLLPVENQGNKGMESYVQNSRNKEIIDAEILKLSDEEQMLIFLRFTQEMTYEEIANETGLSVNAVGVKLFRVLKKLKNILTNKIDINTLGH